MNATEIGSSIRLQPNLVARPIILILPIVLAMVFHAIAMQRWLLILPALIGVFYALLRSLPSVPLERSTSRQWYVVVIGGLLLGIVMPAADVSNGVLPPAAAAAMTGLAVVICVYAVITRQLTIGWVSAWALVAMSGKGDRAGLQIAFLGFLTSSLVAASLHAGVLKHRFREFMIWGMLAAAIASLTLILSILITRVDKLFLNGFERLMIDQPKNATTGLGSSLTLGTKSTISPSRQPLLELSQLPGLLRVNVLDDFNENQWTTSATMKLELGPLNDLVQAKTDQRSIEMLFLENLDDSIPSPAGTTAVRYASPRVGGGWILRGKPDGVTITILADPSQQLPPESTAKSDLLAVPNELRNSLSSLAKQWIFNGSAKGTNLNKAKLVESFFQTHFQYSLTTDLSGDRHPLVTLIEERRPAYCIYFASAMALILRTQEVPARVVTGYAPGEVNPITGRVIVRASDAHAWVEVWSPESERFVAFDPTPGDSRRELMGHDQPPGLLRAMVSALRSNVLRLWLLIRYQPATGLRALLASPWLWLSVGGIVWLWRRRQRRSPAKSINASSAPIDARLKRQYERYLTMLKTAGIDPRPFETDDELLARLEATGNQSLWQAANQFINRYRDFRFGQALPDDTYDEMNLMF